MSTWLPRTKGEATYTSAKRETDLGFDSFPLLDFLCRRRIEVDGDAHKPHQMCVGPANRSHNHHGLEFW